MLHTILTMLCLLCALAAGGPAWAAAPEAEPQSAIVVDADLARACLHAARKGKEADQRFLALTLYSLP